MANETIYPYGQGGQTPSGIGLNAGTFADAYDLAKENNYIFPWMLIDEDEDGEPIKKMIWHTGNGEFIDAIGAEINGAKNGLTVVVSAACDMYLGGKTFPLVAGENNFTFEEIDLTNNRAGSFTFRDSGTTTENKSYLQYVDFGGFTLIGSNGQFPSAFPNVKKIKRFNLITQGWANSLWKNCPLLEELTMTGTFSSWQYNSFLGDNPKLVKVDLSGFSFTITSPSNNTAINNMFYGCSSLPEIDISNFDVSNAKNWQWIFRNCSKLKKLIIGEGFSNNLMTNNTETFEGVTDCVLICTSSTPPKFKNCAFVEGVAQDEYASTWDWLTGHFSAIYVPSDAVQTYKTDTYIENGTVGNTGWSVYANIIHDIAEYDG